MLGIWLGSDTIDWLLCCWPKNSSCAALVHFDVFPVRVPRWKMSSLSQTLPTRCCWTSTRTTSPPTAPRRMTMWVKRMTGGLLIWGGGCTPLVRVCFLWWLWETPSANLHDEIWDITVEIFCIVFFYICGCIISCCTIFFIYIVHSNYILQSPVICWYIYFMDELSKYLTLFILIIHFFNSDNGLTTGSSIGGAVLLCCLFMSCLWIFRSTHCLSIWGWVASTGG